jgi:Uncharacterized protein conserved in bacteria (DUF2330)
MIRRILLAIAAITLVQLASPMAAQACACGGFVADEKVQVDREDAVVELGGGREIVTMRFSARSTAQRAAWVMPVPAKSDIGLGDPQVFLDLERLTRPEYRSSGRKGDGVGGAAAPGSGVTVLEQAKVGPYETAQLTGKDPAEVAEWLRQNGFTLPQNLGDGLRPYLADGWVIAAVKLAAEPDKQLNGQLPPIRLSFATNDPVYPMRLSALAATQQQLRLYVLADHRVEASGPDLTLYFAGRDESRDKFVTRYDGTWPTPADITSDIRLTPTTSDETFRTVIGGESDGTGILGLAEPGNSWIGLIWIIAGAAVLGVLILALVTATRHRPRPGTAGSSRRRT